MIWILIIILNGGGSVAAEQQNHQTCLETMAQATLEPEVKVAYCVWRPHP